MVLLCFSSPPALATAHPAEDVVKATAERVIARLKADRELLRQQPERIYDLVHELIIPHFDFPSMSKWVLGRSWPNATDEQRTRFVQEFQTLLIRTYAKALLEYSDQEIKYFPVNADPNSNLVVVRTEIKQSGAQTIPINYSMHVSGGEWKVVDVSINGVSLVSTYRGSFASEIRKSGMESLINKLAERNTQAVGGPVTSTQ
jgi:phospholipid transport system substrate-binding protein